MKITTLIENTALCDDLATEHGLSFYIETENHKILFDMGLGDSFANNAKKLGVNLETVDIAVLSHAHRDHSGGLKHFLKLNSTAVVYVSANVFELCHNVNGKYIGMDADLIENDRLVYVDDYLKIDEELSLYSCNSKERPFAADSFGQTVKRGEDFVPDPYLHEQYLAVREGEKTVLFSGCSHKGILNITHWFTPDILIGGFHFSKINPVEQGKCLLENSAKQLLRYSTKYYTGHCTGVEQYEVLKKHMSEKLEYLHTGSVLYV